MIAPILIFAWGNPSRGDDALGPQLAEAVAQLALPGVECLTDFQLQVEHALDLKGRLRVLFVDASLNAAPPFQVTSVTPARDASFTSHAMSPAAVLQAYWDVEGEAPPPAWQLAIRGDAWELGEAPTATALGHLAAALDWVHDWLAQPLLLEAAT